MVRGIPCLVVTVPWLVVAYALTIPNQVLPSHRKTPTLPCGTAAVPSTLVEPSDFLKVTELAPPLLFQKTKHRPFDFASFGRVALRAAVGTIFWNTPDATVRVALASARRFAAATAWPSNSMGLVPQLLAMS